VASVPANRKEAFAPGIFPREDLDARVKVEALENLNCP
jgi:hypothetical protein